jgi:hypothetical protein
MRDRACKTAIIDFIGEQSAQPIVQQGTDFETAARILNVLDHITQRQP